MTRRHRVIIVVLSLFILLLGAGIVAYHELRQPPLQKLQQAMDSLEAARTVNAERWAGENYHSAQQHLAAGRQALSEVSAGWWPFESYFPAESLLTESIHLSDLAVSQTEKAQSFSANKVATRITQLSDSLEVWRKILDQDLPRSEDALLYRSASFSLQMAKNMSAQNQKEAAGNYADRVESALYTLERRHERHHSSNRKLVQQSRDWVSRTMEQSRGTKKAVVIIDKSRHTLYVLSSGRVIDSMACDLGYNSGLQKRLKGDGATPEGMYRVTKVNLASKYYKALLLDYPSAEDRQRFYSNISAGVIPADSKIGGLIEIHGQGGLDRDWTDGCVAVTDPNMDDLLHLTSVGTLVTIVRVWEK